MTINWLLFVLFVAIQAADVWTTAKGFAQGDTEAAPLGRSLFKDWGFWPTVIVVKGVGVGLALAATLWVANAWVFTGVLCLGGAYVLWSNLRAIGAI